MDTQLDLLTVQHNERSRMLQLVAQNAEQFVIEFPDWLRENWAIWLQVEQMALDMSKKRSHYAIGTIWEVVRHHTMLRESDSEYKLNNNYRTDVARLFALAHPHLKDFFATRRRTTPALME